MKCDVVHRMSGSTQTVDRLVPPFQVALAGGVKRLFDAENAISLFETARGHSALAAEIHDSFVAARADVGGWMNLSDGPYLSERNRVLGVE